jgi:signal transduction histidine kinase
MPVLSVRTRLIAVITVVSAFGMLAVGFVVYLEERGRVLVQVDELLAANLESAAYLVQQGDDQTGTWDSATQALAAVVQRAAPDDNTGTVGIVDGEARLVPGVPLDVDLLAVPDFVPHVTAAAAQGEPVIGTFAEDGVVWRYLATRITVDAADPSDVVFSIVYDIEAELAEINAAARVWVIASTATIAVIAGAAALVTTRLLRPLRQMRQTAERISAQSLSERLPVQGRDDVSELASTMNDMLDRLDSSMDSQRQLLSDVGHELKTPITIVRGHLEVMDADDSADVRETVELAVDELERMGRLVQDLAAAASLHGPSPIRPTPVDTADLMHQILRKAGGIEGAQVEAGPIAEAATSLDPARVTQAMLQLAQNAVTHGGGRMVISSRVEGDSLVLSVRDFGPGVPDAAKTRVFERFQRLGRHTSGSGLGLNIVQVIARAHGGSAGVTDAVGGGADFTLSVPLTGAPGRSEIVVPPRPPLPVREESA